jgi:hypothetical protein
MDEVETMTTQELMSWLDDKERDRFVKLQETFETDGWKLITQYCEQKVIYHGIEGANSATWEKVNENRGAREAWRQVMAMADEFMNAFSAAAESAKADAAALDQE